MLASASVATGLLLLGHAVGGSAEPDDPTEQDAAGASLVQQALALGLLDESDLAPAAVELATAVPTVTTVVPNAGPTKGGQIVVITGTGFTQTTGADTVTFGANNATSYAVVSATKIVAEVPDGAAGAAVVKVKNGDGPSTSAVNYTYGVPTVASLTPNFASPDAPSLVTITGTGFAGAVAADVKFGSYPAARIWVVNDTQIIAETPTTDEVEEEVVDEGEGEGPIEGEGEGQAEGEGPVEGAGDGEEAEAAPVVVASGPVNVTVTRGSVTSASTAPFLFAPGAPAVTSMSSQRVVMGATVIEGAVKAGDLLTINGTNLHWVKKVNFGPTAVTAPADITVANNGNSLTVKVPARTTAGPVDVTVENVVGVSTLGLGTQLSYVNPVNPTVTAVTPNLLDKARGGTFLITGTNFSGATTATVTIACKATSDGTTDTSGAITMVSLLSDTQMIVVAGPSTVAAPAEEPAPEEGEGGGEGEQVAEGDGTVPTAANCSLTVKNASDNTKLVTLPSGTLQYL
ncbi:MAG: IPT/TIG domain-containing protein [Acidimicrobiales bacterium]